MHYKHLKLTLSSLALTCALTACGGGGDAPTPSSKPAASSTPASSAQQTSAVSSTATSSSQPTSAAASSTANIASSKNASPSSAIASNKIQISAEEFFTVRSLTGLWRLDATYTMSGLANLELPSGQYSYRILSDGASTTAQTLVVNFDDTITEDYCELEGPTIINIADLDASNFDMDEEDKEEFGCTTTSAKFFQSGTSQLDVEMYCNDSIFTSLTFKKISSTPEMNFGKLTFNANGHSNLSAQTGVCGSLLFNHYDLNFTGQRPQDPEDLAIETTNSLAMIDIRAPYNGDYLMLNLIFWNIDSPDSLTPGTYEIIYNKGNQTSAGFVTATLSSKLFAEFGEDAGELFAMSGTVTVTSTSATSIKGSYQLTTIDNEVLSGTFDLDLN
jgi:hypothetical protein